MTAPSGTMEPGLEGRIERVVDPSLLAPHVGGAGLFSTPSMIMLMELAAHSAVEERLPAGHTTVGYEVCVRHLAPANAGDPVVVTARPRDNGDVLVGTGTHKRAIIPIPT